MKDIIIPRCILALILVIGVAWCFLSTTGCGGIESPIVPQPTDLIGTWGMTVKWDGEIDLGLSTPTKIDEDRQVVIDITKTAVTGSFLDADVYSWSREYDDNMLILQGILEIGAIHITGEGYCPCTMTGTFLILLQPGTNSGNFSGEIKYLVETIHCGEEIFLFDVSGVISKC